MTREQMQTAVDEVERGVRDCLTALDRYEAAFDLALAPGPDRTQTEESHNEWDRSLVAAGDRSGRVEELLDEQEDLWRRWHAALERWEQSLQQPGEVPGCEPCRKSP